MSSGGSVLVTGFGPFPGAPVNPTAMLAADLSRGAAPPGGPTLAPHLLPVTWAGTGPALCRLIADSRPDALLMFGLAGRTRMLRVEMRAANAATQATPDADGVIAPSSVLRAGGPAALRARCDGAAMVAALRQSGLKARLSREAGTYLCNAALWAAMEATGPATPVAFIHVPKSVPAARLAEGALAAAAALKTLSRPGGGRSRKGSGVREPPFPERS